MVLTFISGGARSGKSAFAEQLLVNEAKAGGRLVYIASGRATDEEMEVRIQKHREDRREAKWLTIEQPVRLPEVLSLLECGDLVLWDCLTTWLANEMYEGWETGRSCWQQPGCLEQKKQAMLDTVEEMAAIVSHVVIVSNEVLDEWSPGLYNEETELYRRMIGKIHQRLVQMAGTAIEMDHGLPVYWKRVKK